MRSTSAYVYVAASMAMSSFALDVMRELRLPAGEHGSVAESKGEAMSDPGQWSTNEKEEVERLTKALKEIRHLCDTLMSEEGIIRSIRRKAGEALGVSGER